LIDLAFRMRTKIDSFESIERILIETSHHTHYVIGTGSNDPQKFNPKSSRETLDHSIMYIFTVALEDGYWHHEKSYAPERANKPETVSLWQKVATIEKEKWTKLYHDPDPDKKAFGGKIIITMTDGSTVTDEIERANAHPAGARPFVRENYVEKFDTLTANIINTEERDRFISLAENLSHLTTDQVQELNVVVPDGYLQSSDKTGIFE